MVSGAWVPRSHCSGSGLVVTITWLGAGSTVLAPGFSSVPTSRDAVPIALPMVLPSGWVSPEALIAGSEVAGDSADIPAAVSRDEDTSRAIPAVTVVLPAMRGEMPACNATGTLAALVASGAPGTAVPVAGAVLGDHVSALRATSRWGPSQSGGAGAGPEGTPVSGDAEPTVGPC